MKVLFNCVGIKPLLFKKGGAIQKLVSYQVQNLKNDHEITVVGQMAEPIKGVKLVECKKTPSVTTIPDFFLNGILDFLKIWKIDADLIISTHQRNFLPSLIYSWIKKKPMIAWETDHDFWVPPFNWAKKTYYKYIRKAPCIVTVSEVQKQRIIDQGVDPKKVHVVLNAIDIRKFTPGKREKHGEYILYVAKFAERKNQLLLLDVFKSVSDINPDVKLCLVGPKSGAFTSRSSKGSPYYQKCIKFIKSNGLENKVKIVENLDDEALIELYQNASLFVFPSYEEAFGMTLLEAMACGCCCLVNKLGTSLELIGDAGISVDVNNKNAFVGKIEAILKDEILRKRYEILARQRAVKIFDSRVASREFAAIFEKVRS